MPTKNTLFIAHNQNKYIEYEIAFSRDTPQLIRNELATISPEQQPLLCNLKQNVRQSELPVYLRYVTVINSVNSGMGLSSSYYFNVLLPIFKDFGIPHVCVATTSERCITNHAQSFSTSGTVVLFGGDTAVSEFVNGLPAAESDTQQLRIMLIPTGTGNALANSIDLRSPIDAIRSMFWGDRTWKPLTAFPVQLPQDLTPTCSLVVFSFGLHAGLVGDSDTPEMRKIGIDRFKVAARALADRNPTYLAEVPGISHSAHSYLLITQVKELEPKFEISPQGAPPDGKTTYIIQIPKVTGDRFMEIMGAVYDSGNHVKLPEVTYKQLIEPLVIKIPDQPELERRCCIDGKVIIASPGDIKIGVPSYKWKDWNLLIWAK